MEQENLSGWQKRKWYFLVWLATDIIGIALGNLEKEGKAFHFLDEASGVAEDVGNLIGFGLGGLASGIVLAVIVRIFSKNADFWAIALSVGIVVNIIAGFGLFSLLQ